MPRVNLPPSVDEEIRQLKKRISDLEAAAQTRVPQNSVSGGTLVIEDDAGNVSVYAGGINPPWVGAGLQYGFLLYREGGPDEAGPLALALYTGTGTGTQIMSLWDASENIVFSDDGISGQGLSTPFLEIALGRSDTANWPTNSSGTFTDQFFGFPAHQHPKIYFQGRCLVPTGTNAAIQLISGSTVLGSAAVTGSSGAVQYWSIGPVPWAGSHLAFTDLRVQTRITSGTGSIAIMVATAVGQKS